MFNQFPSLAEAFLNYFDVDLVESQLQRERVGRLRYRVYCEEFGYEPAEAFPDGRESDSFDDHALHCEIIHRGSGEAAGCVRLICATDTHRLPLVIFHADHPVLPARDLERDDRLSGERIGDVLEQFDPVCLNMNEQLLL